MLLFRLVIHAKAFNRAVIICNVRIHAQLRFTNALNVLISIMGFTAKKLRVSYESYPLKLLCTD